MELIEESHSLRGTVSMKIAYLTLALVSIILGENVSAQGPYKVRIQVGKEMYQSQLESNDELVILPNKIILNRKEAKSTTELISIGFSPLKDSASLGRQISNRLQTIRSAATVPEGFMDNVPEVDTKSIAQLGLGVLSIREEAGSTLFCGYFGTRIQKLTVSGNVLIFETEHDNVLKCESLIAVAEIVNAEFGNRPQKAKKGGGDNRHTVTGYSRFGMRVYLVTDNSKVESWLTQECDFQSIVLQHAISLIRSTNKIE